MLSSSLLSTGMAALKKAGIHGGLEEEVAEAAEIVAEADARSAALSFYDYVYLPEDQALDGELLANDGKVTEEMRDKQRTARFWRERMENLPRTLSMRVRVFLIEITQYDCFGWEEGLIPADIEESQRAIIDKLGALSGLITEEERHWLAYGLIGESLEAYTARKKEMDELGTAETEAENQFRRSHPRYYPDWPE